MSAERGGDALKLLLVVCPPYREVEGLLKVTEVVRKALRGSITALCVRSEIAQKYYSPFSIQLGKVDKEEEKRIFEEITRVLGNDVMKLSRGGELVSQVLDEIEKGGYDMLIYADVDSKLTKKIAEYSHVPTLIYRRGERLSSFLVCTDGSEHSLRAARFAGKLAGPIGARITLLSVARSEGERSQAEEAVRKAREALSGVYAGQVEEAVRVGGVRETILEEGRQHDLLALAPRGLSKLERVVLGHISLHILERAENNILLVR
ncbi:MAG: universal stress protein [Euryarchaeota archaeon]|nr:universal stress protein [Euryarchaeota archaeon]